MNLQLSNPFAALEHKKAKKKKEKSEREKRKKDKKDTLELEKAIFDQPQLNVSSWADCDDEDDWAAEPAPSAKQGEMNGAHAEEPDSDHEIIDLEEEFGVELGGDDAHEHHEAEKEKEEEEEEDDEDEEAEDKAEDQLPSLPKRRSVPAPVERQLSKKELKKKEMDELDAVLAELGIDSGAKDEDAEGSKTSKKKKKKARAADGAAPKPGDEEASSKNGQSDPTPKAEDPLASQAEEEEEESGLDGDVSIDAVKAKMLLRKKSSKKVSTGAAALAAAEAKARAKKKGSKKDKSKFNQAPSRN